MRTQKDALIQVTPCVLPLAAHMGFWDAREKLLDGMFPAWGEVLAEAERNAGEWFASTDEMQDFISEELAEHGHYSLDMGDFYEE